MNWIHIPELYLMGAVVTVEVDASGEFLEVVLVLNGCATFADHQLRVQQAFPELNKAR